jgi:hypothetical protein
MTDAEQPDVAEALFEPKQGREEINDAVKLEEASVQLWSKTYTVWEACA